MSGASSLYAPEQGARGASKLLRGSSDRENVLEEIGRIPS